MPTLAMSYAMLGGACLGFTYLVHLLQNKLSFKFMGRAHALLLAQAIVISSMGYLQNIYLKLIVYIVFVALYVWSLTLVKFITFKELKNMILKSFSFVRKLTP